MPDNVQSDGSCEINEASRHEDSCEIKEASDGPSPSCDDQLEAISNQLLVQTERDDESTSTSSGGETNNDNTIISPENNAMIHSKTALQSKSNPNTGSKRKREFLGLQLEGQLHTGGYCRSPCEGLRSRAREDSSSSCITDNREPPTVKKSRKAADHMNKKGKMKGRYKCELDGCTMSFRTKAELLLHERNQCPVEGCRKKFNSHKYAMQHQRVHDDERPLKCPWNGCTMSFKWAWARTEHIRVHTGERPYVCKIDGCGLTFRFVSDFSRHRRKTGHFVSQPA